MNRGFPSRGETVRIQIAHNEILGRILERKRRSDGSPLEVDLKTVLKEILTWANEFVPSESGTILLDDPLLKRRGSGSGRLYFVACFGRASEKLMETSMPVDVGIAGWTYRSGKPYISEDVRHDGVFYPAIDRMTKFESKSIICAPIKIHDVTIGVIELINRIGRVNFDSRDLKLLRIFAGYTSVLIQSSLDAKRFADLSKRDDLTGLYNDRYFYERLTDLTRRAVEDDRALSLLFLDLDGFKAVNDSYGHLTGSRVLREIGRLLMDALAGVDAVSARYGGDEFVVILPGRDGGGAALLAERVRSRIESYTFRVEQLPPGGKTVEVKGAVTCSVGLASLKTNVVPGPNIQAVIEALIRQADMAMYEAKRAGKNRVAASRALVCPL
ncbi:MAG TPA: sensor domain-containing diguanylate cyclase [Deltaproteobacteria bacterium]|nr:sensor domain-containing diguanylate cyclase [Deltaproteobacteria bacterium]